MPQALRSKSEPPKTPSDRLQAFETLEILLFKIGHLINDEHNLARKLAAGPLNAPVVALVDASAERLNLLLRIQTELKVRKRVFFH